MFSEVYQNIQKGDKLVIELNGKPKFVFDDFLGLGDSDPREYITIQYVVINNAMTKAYARDTNGQKYIGRKIG